MYRGQYYLCIMFCMQVYHHRVQNPSTPSSYFEDALHSGIFVFYFPFEQYVHGGGLIQRAQNDNGLIYQTAANRLPVLFYLLQVMYMTLQYLPPVGYVPNTSTYDN